MSVGYLYILSNPAMPSLVKIGFTKNTPDGRAEELANATGVPSKFIVEYWAICKYPELIERKLHQSLDFFRVSDNREFFKCSVEEVVSQLYKLEATIFEEHGRIPYAQKAQAKLHRLALERKAEEYRRNRFLKAQYKESAIEQNIESLEQEIKTQKKWLVINSFQIFFLVLAIMGGVYWLLWQKPVTPHALLLLLPAIYILYVGIKTKRLKNAQRYSRKRLDELYNSD